MFNDIETNIKAIADLSVYEDVIFTTHLDVIRRSQARMIDVLTGGHPPEFWDQDENGFPRNLEK